MFILNLLYIIQNLNIVVLSKDKVVIMLRGSGTCTIIYNSAKEC